MSFSTKPYRYALEMGFQQDALFEKVLAIPGIESNWDSEATLPQLEALLKEFKFL